MQKKYLLIPAVGILAVAVLSFVPWHWVGNAAIMNIQASPQTIRPIVFSVKPDILLDLKAFNSKFKFNMSSLQRSFKSCKNQAGLCEKEYKKCKGLLDWSDQQGAEVLFKLKNACISQCAEPAACFGLDLGGGSIPQLQPREPETVICTTFTYTGWGDCLDGVQGRQVLDAMPTNCTGGNPVLSQACTRGDGGEEEIVVPPPPVYTPQNCYAQGSNTAYCPAGQTDYQYLCALQYPSGAWWTGSVFTGCVSNVPSCPCPIMPPDVGGCLNGQTETISCQDPVLAPAGGTLRKTCVEGVWINGPCTPIPVCDPNIPNQGMCTEPTAPQFPFTSCTGPSTLPCMGATGEVTGYRHGICNLYTGEYDYGECLGI